MQSCREPVAASCCPPPAVKEVTWHLLETCPTPPKFWKLCSACVQAGGAPSKTRLGIHSSRPDFSQEQTPDASEGRCGQTRVRLMSRALILVNARGNQALPEATNVLLKATCCHPGKLCPASLVSRVVSSVDQTKPQTELIVSHG